MRILLGLLITISFHVHGQNPVELYQDHISEVKSWRCSMVPSCSEYCRISLEKHGAIKGSTMCTDRLMRCGHDHAKYETINLGDGDRLIDYPEDSNTTNNTHLYSDGSITNNKFEIIEQLIDEGLYDQSYSELLKISNQLYNYSDSLSYFSNTIITLRAREKHAKIILNYSDHPFVIQEPKLNFILGNVYYDLGNYSKSLSRYSMARVDSSEKFLLEKAYFNEVSILARQKKYEEAKEKLLLFNKNSTLYPQSLKAMESIIGLETFKEKNKKLAAALGIIPGAGYLYAGKKGTALASFLLNGLLIYSTYELIKNKLYGLGSLTGLFGTAFYIGNIKGGSKAALKHNNRMREGYLKEIYIFNY